MVVLPLAASASRGSALAGVIGDIGANLAANQLEAWKARHQEPDKEGAAYTLATQLVHEAWTDADLRAALDELLVKLDALNTLAANLDSHGRTYFEQTRPEQLARLGSPLSLDLDVSLTIQGSADHAIIPAGVNNLVFVVAAEAILRTLQTQLLPAAELQEATERYLQFLWNRCSVLDIKGIGLADRVSLNLNL